MGRWARGRFHEVGRDAQRLLADRRPVAKRPRGECSPASIAFDDPPSRQRLLEKLNALGDEAAEHFAKVLPEAADRCRRIVVLTHIPPFREACWYDGRPTNDDWAPHLACVAAGRALRDFMQRHPDHTMIVLCGHTHGGGGAQILENLTVLNGAAKYREPVVQKVLEWH